MLTADLLDWPSRSSTWLSVISKINFEWIWIGINLYFNLFFKVNYYLGRGDDREPGPRSFRLDLWQAMAESTIDWFDMREKYYLLSKKIRFIN